MINLKVEGMNCQHCKASVEKALQEVPGVEQVDVSLEEGFAIVRGSSGIEQLLKALEEAGYSGRLAEAGSR